MEDTTATPTPVTRVGFFARALAYIVDVIATWVIAGAFGGLTYLAVIALGGGQELAMALLALWILPVTLLYFPLLHANGRQPLGKRLVGAVVVDTELRPIGIGRAFGRLLAVFVSTLPCYLGFLWALWDPQRQTFHDKLATTLVVRRDELHASANA